jgi:hypothetical protein
VSAAGRPLLAEAGDDALCYPRDSDLEDDEVVALPSAHPGADRPEYDWNGGLKRWAVLRESQTSRSFTNCLTLVLRQRGVGRKRARAPS